MADGEAESAEGREGEPDVRGTEGKSVKKGVAEKARRIIARKKAEWLNQYARFSERTRKGLSRANSKRSSRRKAGSLAKELAKTLERWEKQAQKGLGLAW